MTVLPGVWERLSGRPRHPEPGTPGDPLHQALAAARERAPSSGTFIALRRIRAPLIVLIVIVAVGVVGLSLIPGVDAAGRPYRMSIFDSFYFMSYTATTIGFGEIPFALTQQQRMWVTFAIFASVVGWAYAIGALLAVMQDRAFRQALAYRRVVRQIGRLAEPFLLLVGYGTATRALARSLDGMGRRFVVVDREEARIAEVDLDGYAADVPALAADARDTETLVVTGLAHPLCEGVAALTGDDQTNLDVTLTSGLLRPGLPVIARTTSPGIAHKMTGFGAFQVVNPLDRFGDHLRIVLRSPAAYQLMAWLTSPPGTPIPPRRDPLPHGRWVVCGAGRPAAELAADLRREGLDVVTLPAPALEREAKDADPVAVATVRDAAAFVAATQDDVTNLWLTQTARRLNPEACLVALHNHTSNAPLYAALGVDFGMLPAEVVVHEVLARLVNPDLMRFLALVPRQGDAWAAALVARIHERSGHRAPVVWRVDLAEAEATALRLALAEGDLTVGDLLASPTDRERSIRAVTLALLRGEETVPAPADDERLRGDDVLLLAGRDTSRGRLALTLHDERAATYVVSGRHLPAGWLWRTLADRRGGAAPPH